MSQNKTNLATSKSKFSAYELFTSVPRHESVIYSDSGGVVIKKLVEKKEEKNRAG